MSFLYSEAPNRSIFSRVAESDRTIRAILSYLELQPGWHYGEGDSAKAGAVLHALLVVSLLRRAGVETFETFPLVDGGVMVSAYRGGEFVDVTCHATGSFAVLHEKDDIEIFDRADLTFRQVASYVEGLQWQSRNFFASYIQCTSAPNSDASRVSHSRTPQAVAFPLLMQTAPKQLVATNAATSGASTAQEWLESRQFFGASPWQASRQAVV